MREDLVPDVSFGTHFFNDLVELNILYLAVYPDKKETIFNHEILELLPDTILPEFHDEIAKIQNVIKIIDVHDIGNGNKIRLYANSLKQQVVCYFSKTA